MNKRVFMQSRIALLFLVVLPVVLQASDYDLFTLESSEFISDNIQPVNVISANDLSYITPGDTLSFQIVGKQYQFDVVDVSKTAEKTRLFLRNIKGVVSGSGVLRVTDQKISGSLYIKSDHYVLKAKGVDGFLEKKQAEPLVCDNQQGDTQ